MTSRSKLTFTFDLNSCYYPNSENVINTEESFSGACLGHQTSSLHNALTHSRETTLMKGLKEIVIGSDYKAKVKDLYDFY